RRRARNPSDSARGRGPLRCRVPVCRAPIAARRSVRTGLCSNECRSSASPRVAPCHARWPAIGRWCAKPPDCRTPPRPGSGVSRNPPAPRSCLRRSECPDCSRSPRSRGHAPPGHVHRPGGNARPECGRRAAPRTVWSRTRRMGCRTSMMLLRSGHPSKRGSPRNTSRLRVDCWPGSRNMLGNIRHGTGTIMNATKIMALALLLGASAGVVALAKPPAKLPAPVVVAPVDPAYMWELGDLYASPEVWTAEHDRVKSSTEGFEKYKGTLGKSAKDMLVALSAFSDAQRAGARLAAYAGLKADEDVRIAANQERQQLSASLQTLYNEKTAWVTPEILRLGADKVRKFEADEPELARRFGFYLDNVLRQAPHTLSDESEGVLAATGDVLAQPDAIYSVLANAEAPFPSVKLSDGSTVTIDQGSYSKYRQSPVRADRKKVFDAFWSMWKKYEGTLGATLTAQVMGEVFNAKVRHYPNSLAAAVFADNMPEAVYRQLVAQANAGLPTMYRYLKLRKKLLGITGDLNYYDIYPSMFKLPAPQH